MTEVMSTTKKTKKPKAPQLFLDELIDQLLARTSPITNCLHTLFKERCLSLQLVAYTSQRREV